MSAQAILDNLADAGVIVTLADPNTIDLDAPVGVLTDELLSVVRAHKADLLGLLIQPDDLPGPWREHYEERAAIREYDGGQAREHAEAEALAETIAAMKREGVI